MNLTKSVSATGTIESAKTKNISADVNGVKVAKVNVKVGDTVKKGDTLATFDLSDNQDTLDDANDNLTSGAKNSSIRLQFIIESVVLCLLGGSLEIILGFILGAVVSTVLGYSAAVPVGAIIVATLFSMIIGIFFGYYPANKAAKLNPIDALRYE